MLATIQNCCAHTVAVAQHLLLEYKKFSYVASVNGSNSAISQVYGSKDRTVHIQVSYSRSSISIQKGRVHSCGGRDWHSAAKILNKMTRMVEKRSNP